jgi:superfamily I DNA/RNA helicase
MADFLNEMEQSGSNKNKSKYSLNDFKWIGTFHSVFLKILKEDIVKLEMNYDKNFSIIDSDDSTKIIKNLLKKHSLNEVFKPNEAK